MYQSADTQLLVRHARGGDVEALNRLLLEYRPILRTLAERKRDGDSVAQSDASDVVQEILLYVARSMATDFCGSTSAEFEAWLRKVVRSKVIDDRRYHRAAQRDVRRAGSLDNPHPSGGAGNRNLPGHESSPSQRAIRKEIFEQAIESLPAKNREVVRLHVIEQVPIDAIAARLSIVPEECVLRYHRGLRTLRRRLAAD
jgi:RNA polymerase sigma-70 factor (ECF subfamily)